MQKMSDIEKILSMGIGRSGLGFEEESRVVAKTIKELQAYRATGLTPTMVKDLIKSCREHEKNAMENAHIVDAYNAIGTVEEVKQLKENAFTGNELAIIASNLIVLRDYQSIGTVEECREAVERMNTDKELESHSEKDIVKGCLALMQRMYDSFLDYLEFMDVEFEKDSEEEPVFSYSYFEIVKRLLLLNTMHGGGNSTMAKCGSLGFDYSDIVEFRKDWSK